MTGERSCVITRALTLRIHGAEQRESDYFDDNLSDMLLRLEMGKSIDNLVKGEDFVDNWFGLFRIGNDKPDHFLKPNVESRQIHSSMGNGKRDVLFHRSNLNTSKSDPFPNYLTNDIHVTGTLQRGQIMTREIQGKCVYL